MKKNVLLTGQDAGRLEIYARQARLSALETALTGSRSQMLDLLSQSAFHLVILDLTSTSTLGTDCAAEIRQASPIPILALMERRALRREADCGADLILPLDTPANRVISYGVSLIHQYESDGDYWEDSSGGKFPIEQGDFFLDQWGHWAEVRQKTVRLTAVQCHLLAYFLQNQHRLLTYQELSSMLWCLDATSCWSMERLIWELRQKVEDDPEEPVYIRSVPDMGYRFFAENPQG